MNISMHSGRFCPPGKSDHESTPGGSARRGGRRANDSGFTPAEIIIGVILLAILSTAVIAQALKLRQQAQDSAAMATIRSAVSAAQGVYAITLAGGTNNFAAEPSATATALGSDAATVAGKLAEQEPGLNFVAKATFNDIKDATPNVNRVWVDIPTTNLKVTGSQTIAGSNPKGFTPALHGLNAAVADNTNIRAGDLIRLGLVGASGSSFCAILVPDSSTGDVSGVGYQSVNETATLTGYGADCGLNNTADNQFHEMPNTIGTDPSIVAPNGAIAADGTGAYAASADVQET